MKKLIDGIKKYYKTINIVFLSLGLYLLIIHPVLTLLLEKISPILTKCFYLEMTGKPCPLCGGTRFLRNIKNVLYDIRYVFNFFGLVLFIIIIEIFFMIINIKKNTKSNNIIKFDIVIHSILFISYILYVIIYISKQWR